MNTKLGLVQIHDIAKYYHDGFDVKDIAIAMGWMSRQAISRIVNGKAWRKSGVFFDHEAHRAAKRAMRSKGKESSE